MTSADIVGAHKSPKKKGIQGGATKLKLKKNYHSYKISLLKVPCMPSSKKTVIKGQLSEFRIYIIVDYIGELQRQLQ